MSNSRRVYNSYLSYSRCRFLKKIYLETMNKLKQNETKQNEMNAIIFTIETVRLCVHFENDVQYFCRVKKILS